MLTAIFEPARVWLRRGALDRRLARGEDAGASAELTRRARQLTTRRCRRRLAEDILSVVAAAEQPQSGYSSAVPLPRRAIIAERDLMAHLAADLTGDEELIPRGIALVEGLLTDGASPLYTPGSDQALHNALIHARAALHLR